jgi:nucleoside-diphosphate-sugar epimerase
MDSLTILGGQGFVGSEYVKTFYDAAIGNISSVNSRNDYSVRSKDVLYFISTVHNYNVFDEPLLDIDTNLSTLVRVLEAWRARPDAKDGVFNFISSWFVYGGEERLDVRETEFCNPKGFYSITKRCAEQLLISYCETYGLKYRILRLANVLGLGDPKVSAKKNALQFMIGQICRNEPIQVYGTGEFYRDYIHVTDCVTAVDLAITRGRLNSIYNIGNGKTWKFIDILRYVYERTESVSSFSFIEPKEFHKTVQSTSFYMNTDELKGLGYIPRFIEERLWEEIIP